MSALAVRDTIAWRRAPGAGRRGHYKNQDVPVVYFQRRLVELLATGTSKAEICRRLGGKYMWDQPRVDYLNRILGLRPHRPGRRIAHAMAMRLAESLGIDASEWPHGDPVAADVFHKPFSAHLAKGRSKGEVCRQLGEPFVQRRPYYTQLNWTLGLTPYTIRGVLHPPATRVRYETAVKLAYAMRMGPEARERPEDELARLIAEQDADERYGDRIDQSDFSLEALLGTGVKDKAIGDMLEAL